jgi:large subunit ribosomal protein L27Ae
MRHFHLKRGTTHCPTVNLDRLWSMMPEGVYDKCKSDSNALAPVIDVTKLVSMVTSCPTELDFRLSSPGGRFFLQGYFKVLGKGSLPSIPIIVKARYFSKDAEKKIKAAGGAVLLTA